MTEPETSPLYEETKSALGGSDPLRKDLDLQAANDLYREAKERLAAIASEGGERDGKATRRVPGGNPSRTTR